MIVPMHFPDQLCRTGEQAGLSCQDEVVTACAFFIRGPAGEGEYFLFVGEGVAGGQHTAAARGRFDHYEGITHTGHKTIAHREIIFFEGGVTGKLREQTPGSCHFPGEAGVFRRIDLIEPVGQYADGGQLIANGGLMRSGIDTVGQSADNEQTRFAELFDKALNGSFPVFGRCAGADDGEYPWRVEIGLSFIV